LLEHAPIKPVVVFETAIAAQDVAALTVASAGSLPGAQSTMKVLPSYQSAGSGSTLRWEMANMGM
jgi:hypothetical protein